MTTQTKDAISHDSGLVVGPIQTGGLVKWKPTKSGLTPFTGPVQSNQN